MCIVDQGMHEDAKQDMFLRSLSSFQSGAAFSNSAVEPGHIVKYLAPLPYYQAHTPCPPSGDQSVPVPLEGDGLMWLLLPVCFKCY